MTHLNKPWIAILALLAFLWLAWYSQQAKASPDDANAFVAGKLATYEGEKRKHLLEELYGN